jgi:hypothetical protein
VPDGPRFGCHIAAVAGLQGPTACGAPKPNAHPSQPSNSLPGPHTRRRRRSLHGALLRHPPRPQAPHQGHEGWAAGRVSGQGGGTLQPPNQTPEAKTSKPLSLQTAKAKLHPRPPNRPAPGYVWQMAENEWGNAVVATALAVVDDTALTGKALVADVRVRRAPPSLSPDLLSCWLADLPGAGQPRRNGVMSYDPQSPPGPLLVALSLSCFAARARGVPVFAASAGRARASVPCRPILGVWGVLPLVCSPLRGARRCPRGSVMTVMSTGGQN